jgi:putative aminopeptidase FrvX
MSGLKSLDYGLLKQLTEKFSPSGNETEVADFIIEQVKTIADSIQVDLLGNLIIRKRGNGIKVMIVSHMDEVGIMITHIDPQGYLYFVPVGGLKGSDLVAKRVVFKNKRIGVVSRERKQKTEDKTFGKVFIDIGVNSEAEARCIVTEGDMATLVGDFQETEGHVISKALDNRIGCFLAIEILKQIHCESDLFFTFTVQEEVGSRGAKIAAATIQPDLALIIDTTISYDTPNEFNRTSLGRGVAIKVMDESIVVSPKIKNWMADICSQKKVPFQWEIISTGATDCGPVHLTQGGIPTGGIAIPVRYLHTANEIAAKADIRSAYNLLLELLLNPYKE